MPFPHVIPSRWYLVDAQTTAFNGYAVAGLCSGEGFVMQGLCYASLVLILNIRLRG